MDLVAELANVSRALDHAGVPYAFATRNAADPFGVARRSLLRGDHRALVVLAARCVPRARGHALRRDDVAVALGPSLAVLGVDLPDCRRERGGCALRDRVTEASVQALRARRFDAVRVGVAPRGRAGLVLRHVDRRRGARVDDLASRRGHRRRLLAGYGEGRDQQRRQPEPEERARSSNEHVERIRRFSGGASFYTVNPIR